MNYNQNIKDGKNKYVNDRLSDGKNLYEIGIVISK